MIFIKTSKRFAIFYVLYCLLNSTICVILPFIFSGFDNVMSYWLIAFAIIMIGAGTRIKEMYAHFEIFLDISPLMWIIVGLIIITNNDKDLTIVIGGFIVAIINMIVISIFMIYGMVVFIKTRNNHVLVY